MEYKLEEISPEGFTITIADKVLNFGFFTWADAIYFEKNYGKKSILALIAEKPEELTGELAWRLLKEKNLFGTMENFINSFSTQMIKQSGLSDKLMAALGICVSKQEVKKSKDNRFCGDNVKGNKTGRSGNIFKQIFRYFGFGNIGNVSKTDTNKTI